jgi:hypothetical protein
MEVGMIRNGSTVKVKEGARPDLKQEYGVDYAGRIGRVKATQTNPVKHLVKLKGYRGDVSFSPYELEEVK